MPVYRERERIELVVKSIGWGTERGRVHKAPSEREKYPRPAIVRSLAKLRPLE